MKTGVFKAEHLDLFAGYMVKLGDDAIYKTSGVMSGGIITLTIGNSIHFSKVTLHNGYHPLVEKIGNLLNTVYLSDMKRKLWVFNEEFKNY